ncbi:MAG: hypothetical protein IPM96_15975 [Ignavibacteria bacterium]|nr:hypothetical protein [Ignavibacteria bacterium]
MNLKRGKKYIEDIRRLKSLKLKDKPAYMGFRQTVMKEYNISQRTLYRDMNERKTPGLRKTRNDSGKLKSKMSLTQQRIMSEAMESGLNKKEAVRLAVERANKKVSSRVASRTKPISVSSTNFDDNIKPFLEKLCGYDLMSPKSAIKLKFGKLPFNVGKEDLADIVLILTNAYNRSNLDNSIPLDKNELFRKKIFQLLEYSIKLAEEGCDLKSLESITRMYNSIQEDHDLGTDFELVYKICATLKPGISRTEIISLIKQFAKGE